MFPRCKGATSALWKRMKCIPRLSDNNHTVNDYPIQSNEAVLLSYRTIRDTPEGGTIETEVSTIQPCDPHLSETENNYKGDDNKLCVEANQEVSEAMMKTAGDVSDVNILATGPENENCPGLKAIPNSDFKVNLLHLSQVSISSSDELLQVAEGMTETKADVLNVNILAGGPENENCPAPGLTDSPNFDPKVDLLHLSPDPISRMDKLFQTTETDLGHSSYKSSVFYKLPLDSLENYSWYHGQISRKKAESFLKKAENGSFLIRTSETRNSAFVFCIRYPSRIRHFSVFIDANENFYMRSELKFTTLGRLVSYYCLYPESLNTILLHPVPKTENWERNLDELELDRYEISLNQQLHDGEYTEVYEALWEKYNKKVAVKSLKKLRMRTDDYLLEANVMKKVQHTNLVRLLGVCFREWPLYIITEFMDGGNLLEFLRDPVKSKDCDTLMMVNFSTQIVAAMMYLEKMNYVHRDLAARNCLLAINNLVKVGDFGFSRLFREDMFKARQGSKFAIKWSAPEALEFIEFTVKSDVWSFGILLWEIVTFGKLPYPGVDLSQIYEKLSTGYRMSAPEGCPSELYELMKKCWKWDANDRPSFQDIHIELDNILKHERESAEKKSLQSWKWIETSKAHRERFLKLREFGRDHPSKIQEVNGVRVCCLEEFLVGSGGDGTRVYVGLGNDGCEKAVKCLRRDTCTDLAEHEKNILVKVKSNHVVKYWFLSDKEYDKQHLFLILDLCEETLESFVSRESSDHLTKVAPDIIRHVLQGLHDLHHSNPPILHRDLKPNNILRNVDGKWLLADFGDSRFLRGSATTYRSNQRGTKDWRAAESHPDHSRDLSNDGKVHYKKESDIQVAGIVAFYILTKGEHAFGEEADRLRNLLDDKPVGLNKLDFAANDLLTWMLKHDPKDRPKAEEALKHPYLQPMKKQFEMLCKMGNQLELKSGDKSSKVVADLNSDPTDWTTLMRPDVLSYLCTDIVNGKSKTFYYGPSWSECLRLIRNVNQHWLDRPRPLPQPEPYYAVGDPQEYFLRIFPKLPVIVHKIVRSCDWKDRSELKEYFT